MIQNKALMTTLGWRECVSLPGLGVNQIKVKVDTGAKNSALHASNINLLKKSGEEWLSFDIYLDQNKINTKRSCMARSMGCRWVTNSGGKREKRFVIETPIRIGDKEWPIIITLSKREQMQFRMLLGRTAIKGKYVVDPSRSFCCKLI
mgnify:CR=1 FL=1|jgi:hypothetical protein